MSKQTPGPWTFMEDEIFWGEIRGPNFELIAVMPELDERSEDFRLIAAAPELLEALERASVLLDALRLESGIGHCLTEPEKANYKLVDTKVKQVIAKAKGRGK